MKIKTFESWNDNIIDNSLFVSGRAKYDPKVAGGIIHYKTGNVEPYFFAEITKKGDKFICKVYKKKKDGEEQRIRNKIKKDLKTAHNYVREFLNQKLRSQKKKKSKGEVENTENIENMMNIPEPQLQPMQSRPMMPPMEYQAQPKSKTIIRRFV
jgi:hypothetical protein